MRKKIILTHRKDLVSGDYLIDDRSKNGASEFCDEWIQFGSEHTKGRHPTLKVNRW